MRIYIHTRLCCVLGSYVVFSATNIYGLMPPPASESPALPVAMGQPGMVPLPMPDGSQPAPPAPMPLPFTPPQPLPVDGSIMPSILPALPTDGMMPGLGALPMQPAQPAAIVQEDLTEIPMPENDSGLIPTGNTAIGNIFTKSAATISSLLDRVTSLINKRDILYQSFLTVDNDIDTFLSDTPSNKTTMPDITAARNALTAALTKIDGYIVQGKNLVIESRNKSMTILKQSSDDAAHSIQNEINQNLELLTSMEQELQSTLMPSFQATIDNIKATMRKASITLVPIPGKKP